MRLGAQEVPLSPLVASWAPLGVSWDPLGACWGPLQVSWALLELPGRFFRGARGPPGTHLRARARGRSASRRPPQLNRTHQPHAAATRSAPSLYQRARLDCSLQSPVAALPARRDAGRGCRLILTRAACRRHVTPPQRKNPGRRRRPRSSGPAAATDDVVVVRRRRALHGLRPLRR